jgi:Fe-S cluster assembly protein SufD
MTIAVQLTAAEEALGLALPHRRLEEWKWTDLRRLVSKPYRPHQAVAAAAGEVDRLLKASPFAAVAARRIVFVNGRLDAGHSHSKLLQPGRPESISEDPLATLNEVLARESHRIVLDGAVDTPVEIIHVSTAGAERALGTRVEVDVPAGGAATLIETHVGEGDYLSNPLTLITVGEGARLDRIKVERESGEALHLSHVDVRLAKAARFNDFTLTSGARVNRQNGLVTFNGEGAEARVTGAYLLGGSQHADTRLVVDHRVPHCTSREVFKCVMDGHARGIFQGKVIVQPDAQKTDGKQSSHALLLSETAEFDAKPELEIYADDVVCGHGATSGDLNHDHLFYLMSRGIPEVQARAMLVAAFVGEVFDGVAHDGLREALVSYAETWLISHKR